MLDNFCFVLIKTIFQTNFQTPHYQTQTFTSIPFRLPPTNLIFFFQEVEQEKNVRQKS